MVIYEVNIQINPDIQNKFLSWLNSHAKQMLKFDGFEKYIIYRNKGEDCSFSIHYHVNSIAQFEDYINNHSSNMREKGQEEFKSQMTINRKVLLKL